MSRAEEGGEEEDLGAVIKGPRICLTVEDGGLVRLYSSCDHEVGGKANAGGTHEAGEKADVGGGGQQICVSKVTCVV